MNPVVKAWLKYPISRKARNYIKEWRRQQAENAWMKEKLIMTLLLKDEEHIVEQNIRFHCAMGVDGVIVTLHNSTDRTEEILRKLQKEGLVLEIIHQTNPCYLQNVFVDAMVDLARKKYHATWVINADADEFWYSKSLNLKLSIQKGAGRFANVLWVNPIFFFPDDREDFLSCPYFITRRLQKFETEYPDVRDKILCDGIHAGAPWPKVIHKTSGNPKIAMGNHDVSIRKRVFVESADINLYHYHIQNYAQYEAKVERYKSAAGAGVHMQEMLKLYSEGRLREDYESKYGEACLTTLLEHGAVTRDPSVYNYLKYKNII